MQTFLPYPSFGNSVRVLDNKRLNKQRLETLQIIEALLFGGGYSNHPAVKMWQGYIPALVAYGDTIATECDGRGIRDNANVHDRICQYGGGEIELPDWIGGPIHASHRANLLRKDIRYYRHFGWTEEPTLGYHWPKPRGTEHGRISTDSESDLSGGDSPGERLLQRFRDLGLIPPARGG